MKSFRCIRIAWIILLLAGIQYQLRAQTDIFPEPESFKLGYIITPSNDSVYGFVEYKPNSRKYLRCRIEIDNEMITYELYQVREFGFINSKHFSTRILSGRVVEIIVSGSVSLYKEGDGYLLGLEGQLISLQKKENFRAKMAEILAEFPELHDPIADTKYTTASLSGIVIRYNELKGNAVRVYDRDLKKASLHLGFAPGLSYTYLQSEVKSVEFNRLNGAIRGATPSLSLLLQYAIPKIANGFYFQLETEMNHTRLGSFNVMDEPDGKHFYESRLSATALHLPFSVNYRIPDRRYMILFHVGAGYVVNLNADTYLKEEIVSGAIVESFENKLLSLNDGYFSALGGIGVEREWEKLRAGVMVRYIHNPSLSTTEFYSTNMNRIQIVLYIYP